MEDVDEIKALLESMGYECDHIQLVMDELQQNQEFVNLEYRIRLNTIIDRLGGNDNDDNNNNDDNELNEELKIDEFEDEEDIKDDSYFSSYVVLQTGITYFGVLCDCNILLYQTQESYYKQKTNPIDSIDLIPYNKVIPFDLGDPNSYEFQLIQQNEDFTVIGVDTNNIRHEWITHIDYIINHKQQIATNNNKKNNDDILENLQIDPLLVGTNMSKEKVLDLFTDIQYEHKCDHLSNDQCDSFQRLLIIDTIYSNWSQLQQQIDCSISDIITFILQYNKTSLLEDYIHCAVRKKNTNNNDDNKRCGRLGSLNEGCCDAMRRNNIDRTQQRQNDEYNMDSNKVSFEQILDTLHCYIHHSHSSKISISKTKYNINIEDDDNEDDDDDDDVEDNKDDNDNDDEQKHDNNNNNNNNNNGQEFGFGEDFTYYHDEKERLHFVTSKYKTLKEEVTENEEIHTLSIESWYNTYNKAIVWIKTNKYCNLRAQSFGEWNEIANIVANKDKIGINHIISLLLYTNFFEFQCIWKQCCRRRNAAETDKELDIRHSSVAHWRRYLLESCVFFGETMKKKDRFYCGLSIPLNFVKWNKIFSSPLSTTDEISVATNFATPYGILLELRRPKGDNINCKYFDVSILSDLPHESEKFFCGAPLHITNISYKNGWIGHQWIYAIQLMHNILKGSILSKEYIGKPVQQNLCCYIKHYGENTKFHNDDEPMLTEAMNYTLSMFKEMMDRFLKNEQLNNEMDERYYAIWLNIGELKRLKKKYSKLVPKIYILKENKPAMIFNKIGCNKKIGKARYYQHIFTNDMKEEVEDDEYILRSAIFKYEINEEHTAQFNFEIAEDKDTGLIMVYLQCISLEPKKLMISIDVSWEIYCHENECYVTDDTIFEQNSIHDLTVECPMADSWKPFQQNNKLTFTLCIKIVSQEFCTHIVRRTCY